MAIYNVKLGSNEGDVFYRRARGSSAPEVARQFRGEGYYVFSIKRVFEASRYLGLGRKIPIKDFIVFNKEFRGLVRSGIPIVEGFDILLKRMKATALKDMLVEVRDALTRGESLSTAFQRFGDDIPRYYPALIQAGEQSGGLVEVLDRFIAQEERIRKARKKFRQALTYPIILLVAGVLSLYVLMTRAMPEFAALYKGADQELPLLTRIVITLSDLASKWSLHFIVISTAAAILLYLYFKTEQGGRVGEKILLAIPVLGTVRLLQNQNIFARAMRLLIGGGVPVPQALAIVADAVPSRVFGADLHKVHGELIQGEPLQESLERHTRLTEMAGEMIRVGEAAGTLGEMLEYVAEHGEEKVEDNLEIVSGMIAPLMLLFIGLLISFLVIAMYLPMFGSYETLGV